MSDKQIFHLVHAEARRRAMAAVADAPEGYGVVIQPRVRSLDQNAKFHALCADIARAGLTWAGKRRSAAEWKVLLVSGHAVATNEQPEIIPGLEGEFINVRESTAAMSKARGASLIEYTQAFMAQNSVVSTEEAFA